MVHYIALYKLKDDISADAVDDMMRRSRSRLLRINEAHNIRSGRRIDEENEYHFFISADFESMEKLKMFQDDPQKLKFDQEVMADFTDEKKEYLYETEPGKNTRYS